MLPPMSMSTCEANLVLKVHRFLCVALPWLSINVSIHCYSSGVDIVQ